MASSLEVLDLKPFSGSLHENLLNDNEIYRFKKQDLSYNDFYWQFMERNYPVVLTDVSNDWECRRQWIKPATEIQQTGSLDNQIAISSATDIDYDYLKGKIGNCKVPVANCKKEYFNSHAKSEISFFDFLHYWQTRREHCSADGKLSTELSNIHKISTTEDLFYLKDWHLKDQNADYDFYKVPKHFASDWLNEHLIETESDDYRFVYMGPKETWTPFHSDVFGSFSWSTNIMGIKKWLILPSGEEVKLYDTLGNLPFCVNESLLNEKNVKYFTLMQNENESIFVPSGWYHQVWNMTDTISINHNWFNACNLQRIWYNLHDQMAKVIKEIDDCRQMDYFMEHCQTMLRASFGLNYLDFLQLLECITKRRLKKFINNNTTASNELSLSSTSTSLSSTMSSTLTYFDQYIPNDYHVHHDLERIYQVIELMLQDSIICEDRTGLYRNCIKLRESISPALSLN